MSSSLNERIETAVAALRAGVPVVMLDDNDRENEADLVIPAETITQKVMVQFIRAGGLVCLCLEDERLRQLDLPPMVQSNSSAHGTAFTVSIDAVEGVTTGISAADRLATVRAAIDPKTKPEDLARPGHIFPLRAVPGGVLARRGHTEGSVDLVKLAGLMPAAVIVELMDENGEMVRGNDAIDFAMKNQFPVITIEDLVAYKSAASQDAA